MNTIHCGAVCAFSRVALHFEVESGPSPPVGAPSWRGPPWAGCHGDAWICPHGGCAQKRSEMLRNAQEHSETHRHAPKPPETLRRPARTDSCPRQRPGTPSRGATPFPWRNELFWTLRSSQAAPRNAQKHSEARRTAQKCSEKCPEMLRNAQTRPETPRNAQNHPETLRRPAKSDSCLPQRAGAPFSGAMLLRRRIELFQSS